MVGKFLNLEWRHKLFVIWLAFNVIKINRSLKLSGLKETHTDLFNRKAPDWLVSSVSTRRIVHWVKTLNAKLIAPTDTCLRHSLLIWWLLHSRGKQAELCIGIKKDSSQLLGHAWVEVNGHVINDHAENVCQYKKMDMEKYSSLVKWAD